MKLLKTIIKIVLFIVLLLVIGVVVFLLIIMDNGQTDFTPDDSLTLENVLGSNLEESLNNISLLSDEERTTDKNKIELSLTIEELNNFVVQMIRSNVNSNYLKDGNNTVLEAGPAKLKSIFFEPYNENAISVKARVEALNFYKTSLTLAGMPKIDGNNLVFQFTDFKFGNSINISKDQVISVKDFFKLELGNIQGFNLDDMTFSFDISSFMNSSNAFSNIVSDVNKDCTYANNSLTLAFDTKDIFTPIEAIQEPALEFTIPPMTDLISDSLTLTENQFNYLIAKELNDTKDEAKEAGATGGEFKIGNSKFTYNLDKLYYNIDTEEMQAYIYINECKTNLVASVEILKNYSGGYLESLDINVLKIKLGKKEMDAKNFFSKINIPASNFTFGYDIKIEDMVFNKTLEDCTITFHNPLLP